MKSFTEILENKDNMLEELSIKKAILFTDIVKSSVLWAKYGNEMYEGLLEHDKQMQKLIKPFDAYIVKQIGDSFMIVFNSKKEAASDALKFSIKLIEELENNPIKVGSDQIKLRIGFAYGEMYERKTKIQNKELSDFFGNTVGTGSRMESVVSGTNGFAFANVDKVDDMQSDKMTKLLKEKCIFEVIEYENDCRINKDKKITRSARLLTDLHRHKCENINKLKGVKPLRAYKCILKKKE